MSKTYADLLREGRALVPELLPDQAAARAAEGALLLDVREPHEWDAGHVPGAVHVPLGRLEAYIGFAAPDTARPVMVYCATGVRSLAGARTLQLLGYQDVASVAGGLELWRAQGLPVEAPARLTPAQQQRYSRHLLIPEVGIRGQARLLESKVLFIGAGGLGSSGLLYLAAAGVGTIGIVDFDVVDASNLQRQVVHNLERLGQPKIASAAAAIGALNPDVRVIGHEAMLTDDNVDELIAGYDVIIDGTDTFETRYTLNDAAVRAGIPVVHASVFRFEGQLTTFVPFEGPCYRCLYPTPPPPELAPGCSVAGVLGVVPGTMGLLQATEALKLLLGIGETYVGRLVIYDALDGTFQELSLRRDPACPACGTDAEARMATTATNGAQLAARARSAQVSA
ncbi:MAG TPA: molybdopterin-synthase adenylyltransferase MoeB [Candidatus Dormibacteraeota bacterium]|nr:molybdopterin-synthase adenylyltransferase MoeB [Candidatus Dormibacteraeota bacterium]